MRKNDILIRQIIFDLDIASQANFQAYTDTISQIVKERIGPMLEDIALKLNGNSGIVVKNLLVDLDEIDLDNWDAHEGALYDQLFNQLRPQEISSKEYVQFDNKSLSLSELLNFIAEFGLLPWSYNTKQKVNSFFKEQIEKFENKDSLYNILISNQIAYSRIFNILDQKSSLIFLKFLLKRDYPHYKRLQDFNKSLSKVRGLSSTLSSIKKDEYQILNYFYKNPNNTDRSIQQSINYLKKTYSLTSKELRKLNLIEKKGRESSVLIKDQLNLSGSEFKEQHFKQLISLLIKLEDKNSIKKTLGSKDFTDSSYISKFLVKGDFFKTLKKILQLYKKDQNLSEQKLLKTLVDFLIQKKASNKFEQYVVLTLGEAIFREKKYESLRNSISFKSFLSAVKIRSLESFEEVVDVLDTIFTLEARSIKKHMIQASALRALYPALEKTKPKELFIAVLKSFAVDRKLPPSFQIDSLDEQKISKIFDQVRRMQTLPTQPTTLDSDYFEFILNIDNEITNLESSKQRSVDFISNIDQLNLSGSEFKEQHFKQLISLLIKLEDKNSIKKTLGSKDFTDSSYISKFLVKGDFFKTLKKILQLYKKDQNLSEQKLLKTLVDFLIQKKASNKFEQYVVLTLGEAIFREKKYESLRNSISFKSFLSAVKIRSLESFEEVVDVLDTIFTLEARSIKKHMIQASALRALYPALEKTKPKELFIAVLKSFAVDRKLPPSFQIDSLDEQKISKIFDQVRRMQTLPTQPTTLDSKYFEFILNTDNEITNLEASKQRSADFISIKDILKSTKSLLQFLKAYRLREEVLNSFSVLTLQPSTEKAFSALLKANFQSWLQIEQALIKIQNQIHFSDLESKQFSSVLRYFLIKSLASGESVKESYSGEFTFNFLSFIELQSSIYLNKLKEVLMEETIISEIEEVGFGFSVYIDNTSLDLLPQKTKATLFYKNVYYSYLKTKTIPVWSSLELIDDFEIVNFIKVLIDKNDSLFLEALFSQEQIVKNILIFLKGVSEDYFRSLIEILQKEKTQGFLLKLFTSLTKDRSNQLSPYILFEIIVNNQLWKIKNPLYLKTRFTEILKSLNPEWEPLFKSKLAAVIKKKDIDVKLGKSKSQKEYQFLMSYLVDSGVLPVSQEFSESEIIEKLTDYLAKNPERSIGYLLELNISRISETAAYSEVFTKELILSTIEAHFSDAPLFLAEIQTYFKELETSGTDDVLFYKSLELILTNYVVENKSKQSVIPMLINLVSEFKGKSYTELIKQLKLLFEQSKNRPIEQSLLLYRISQDEIKSDAFRQYVELGFYPLEMREISQIDLFKNLVKTYPLLLKKRLHLWSQDAEKLKRLFKLVTTEKERRLLVALVHPQLLNLLDALPEMINLMLKETPITFSRKPTSADQLQVLLTLWAKTNFNVNPYELIVDFIKDFLAESKISDDYFTLQIDALKEDFKSDIELNELKPFFEQTSKRRKPNKVEILNETKLNKTELEEGISIHNSGLVIAWPFLNILFSKLDLVEDGKLKSDEATQKAIAASQYLVDGKNEIDETELLLNKILCGADLDFYVDDTLVLNEIELGICDMALKTIVSQWGKVKSVATLRDYFFKRKGVLKFDENSGAELHVEKETRDILIKFLPWNLSVIKTSIMNTKLIIHWKYN